jgi:hypothetical protein
MSDNLLDYLKKCRLCLEYIPTSNCIEIDKVLLEQIEELIGESVSSSWMFQTFASLCFLFFLVQHIENAIH